MRQIAWWKVRDELLAWIAFLFAVPVAIGVIWITVAFLLRW